MEKLDVLYTANEKFLDIMLASIISLIENSNVPIINLHIIAEEFSDESYAKISKVLSNYLFVNVDFYPMEDFNIEKFDMPRWRDTIVPNARLFFQEYMKSKLSNIDNLLYLDSDTVVVGDLNELGCYQASSIAGVKDPIQNRSIRRLNLENYYNSGVLYININDWVKEGYQNKIIENIDKYRDKLALPDQDLINITLADKFTALPLEYNLGAIEMVYGFVANKIYFDIGGRQIAEKEIRKAKNNPKIYHAFGYGDIKPWDNNTANPLNEEFMKYILKANPDFSKEEIEGLFRIFAFHPNLMKSTLFLKSLMPKRINKELADIKKKILIKKDK